MEQLNAFDQNIERPSVEEFLNGWSDERLQTQKVRLKVLLAMEDKNWVPPINKRTGKPLSYHKMPWMVPVWQRGLELVNKIIDGKANRL